VRSICYCHIKSKRTLTPLAQGLHFLNPLDQNNFTWADLVQEVSALVMVIKSYRTNQTPLKQYRQSIVLYDPRKTNDMNYLQYIFM
jgi:hypothetical protein